MDFDQVVQRLDRFLNANPEIANDVYIAPNATVLGKVTIGSGSSIWFQSVIRADINEIRIGSETNIQDGSILHVADRYGLAIGNQVSCGHRAILHACSIHDRVLVGMNAVVMDGAEVGAGSIIGAGALLTKETRIPPGSLVLGSPAKVVRTLTTGEQKGIEELAAKYVAVGKYYLGGHAFPERRSEIRTQESEVQELQNPGTIPFVRKKA
jgi:carbonic anhydrase/acetyltransferase-like protein (isoleucine patch superfamily)